MFLKTPFGDREMFGGAFDSSTPIPRPSQWGGSLSYSGQRVSLESATSLPAFMRALRLLCETPAMMPLVLSRGEGPTKKPQPDAPQLDVLRRPNPEMTPFQFRCYVIASMLAGNGLIWKVKVRGAVKRMYPLMPALCKITREPGGEVVYKIRKAPNGPVVREVGKADVIHLPGILLNDPVIGVSLIEAHRHGIGTSLARQEFEGRYLANDGAPGIVLKHPDSPGKPQRDEMRDGFEARHGGAGKAGRPAMMWGGWDLDRIAVNLQEAQFIESQRYSVQEIARMTGVPASFLDEPPEKSTGHTTPEHDNRRLLTYGTSSWETRFGQGLAADPDLFPEPDWNVDHDHAQLLQADEKTRYEGYRQARQGGWVTANEIRAREGLPEIEGGDQLQETPVGGAPNTQTESA